jgi:hypothetical protein
LSSPSGGVTFYVAIWGAMPTIKDFSFPAYFLVTRAPLFPGLCKIPRKSLPQSPRRPGERLPRFPHQASISDRRRLPMLARVVSHIASDPNFREHSPSRQSTSSAKIYLPPPPRRTMPHLVSNEVDATVLRKVLPGIDDLCKFRQHNSDPTNQFSLPGNRTATTSQRVQAVPFRSSSARPIITGKSNGHRS